MPQIGWFEILVIVVLSILIIGPKDFPIMLKKIGSWMGSFKNYFSEIQKDITDVENTVEEKTYIETASPDELTHSITVDDLTYLIPEADYSLGGIDYIVRSAQRQDGIKITIQNKQTLGDYLEYLRIEKDESKLVS